MKTRLIMIILLLATTAQAQENAAPANAELAKKGYEFLKTYCYRCHGTDFKVPGMNVLDRDTLTSKRADPAADNYLAPGKPDESQVWQRVGDLKDMPPEDAPAQPSDSDRQVFREWIEAGAPFPVRPTRTFLSEKDTMTAIRDHLRAADPDDRTYLRYYSLLNLANNPNVTEDELRLYRAGLAKLVNSLSWENSIVVPQEVGTAGAVYAIDLRDLGWDQNNLWRRIIEIYPYGLKYDRVPSDPDLNTISEEVYRLANNDAPVLRADWFIATASRPPLYHALLMLPTSAKKLEEMLKVDVLGDFRRNRLARAAFATSGVSGQNRLVDRHDALYGAYWKSYDFKTNEGPGNLFKFPLGPDFAGHPFPNQAFHHDGGEIIFNLPNGLQAYLLVDGKDNRIDAGPIEVVSDALKTSGTPAIVNGLSCMACHKHGAIPFVDSVRGGLAVFGDAKRKTEQLFPEQARMDKLIAGDQARFLRSLLEATGPFLQVKENKSRKIQDFPEPIGAIARLYQKDLGPEEVACELGLPNSDELKQLVKRNSKLRELGLGPLQQGATIKRELWQSRAGILSLYQQTSSELELGIPHVPL